MDPYHHLSDGERRKLIQDFSEAARRIRVEDPKTGGDSPWTEKTPWTHNLDRGARRGIAATAMPPRPPWLLRLKIDSYACARGYALCGLPQYFSSLFSFLTPDRDYIHPRFARLLVQDQADPVGPAGYSLQRVLSELERRTFLLLTGGQLLKRSTDGRAPLKAIIAHDLINWEPFAFSLLSECQRFDRGADEALQAVRLRTDLQKGVDVFDLIPVIRPVFRAVLLTTAEMPEIRRHILNAAELVKNNYRRAFGNWSQLESIVRRIDNEAREFLACYARLRWFAHHLYPALLKLLGLFEEEENLERIRDRIRQFVGLEEKDILIPVDVPAAAPAAGDEPALENAPPVAVEEPGIDPAEEYRGILTLLEHAFPGSGIENIAFGEASALFWFQQKIWARQKVRPGIPARRVDYTRLLGRLSRLDPLASVILLYEILGEMLSAVDSGELSRLTLPLNASPDALRGRFDGIRRHWPMIRDRLFERYLQEIDFYAKELPRSRENPLERRTIEIVNQVRNHIIRGYGWTAMSWDRLSYFKCEPLYELAHDLVDLLQGLTIDREQISRENPLYVGRLQEARVARFDEGAIMRQLASYIQAIPADKRLLKDAGADGQRVFLEILLGTADLLDFLLNGPRSPLRRADGRIYLPDAEDQELQRRIHREPVPLRVDLRRDFEEVDALTGLLNKNHYLKTAPRIFQSARESGEALSLLVLDLDHFKAVNDAHGHPFGDEILRATARIVLSSMRQEDTAMRFGGEEIVIFVRGDCRAAFVQGERIRNNLGEHLAERYGRELAAIPEIMAARELEELRRAHPAAAQNREAVLRRWRAASVGTVSIGVAQGLEAAGSGGELPFPCGQETELLARADRMLYLAKESGRNRVVGMVDRLRLPLLVEEFHDYLLYLQENPGRRAEDFPRYRHAAGRPLRFASYVYEEFLA